MALLLVDNGIVLGDNGIVLGDNGIVLGDNGVVVREFSFTGTLISLLFVSHAISIIMFF